MSIVPSTTEYDRFGPWIDTVRTAQDVPRLFSDYDFDPQAVRLTLKVPRNIERRDADPSMDLYDHLLIVRDVDLTILSRRIPAKERSVQRHETTGYDVASIRFDEIASLHDSINLLDGRFEIRTIAGAWHVLRYNGSARDTVAELMGLLKGGFDTRQGRVASAIKAGAPKALDPRDLAPGERDVIFVSDALELRRTQQGLDVWACHGRVPAVGLDTANSTVWQRLARWVSPVNLSGALIAADAVALEVLSRRHWLQRARLPEHSHGRTVVALASLDGVRITPHPRFAGVLVVTLTSGDSATEIVVPHGSDAARIFANGLSSQV